MSNRNKLSAKKESGAAMIEMALSFPLFVGIVLAVIDFSLLLFEFGKGVEVARHTLREAIVSTSLADDAALDSLSGCDDVSDFSKSAGTFQVPDCTAGVTFCNDYAKSNLRFFTASDLTVSYGCSGAGYIERATGSNILLIPEVKVDLDVTYTFLFSHFLGLAGDSELSINKTFTATRTGEDMETVAP